MSEGVSVRIKIAGPCAAGKSTLAARLRALGYDAGSTAQDHSYVPDMWQRINPPDLLIYLDLSLATAWQRGRIGWSQAILDEQKDRLRHARAHCDLYLCTDALTEAEVLAQTLTFLHSIGRPQGVAPTGGRPQGVAPTGGATPGPCLPGAAGDGRPPPRHSRASGNPLPEGD